MHINRNAYKVMHIRLFLLVIVIQIDILLRIDVSIMEYIEIPVIIMFQFFYEIPRGE